MPAVQKLKTIHTLLSTYAKERRYPVEKEEKKTLVKQFTGQREESTKGLTDQEADVMIAYLKSLCGQSPQKKPGDVMRKNIIAMAHEMGWELPDGKADMARINVWCVNYSYLRLPLDDYEYDQLPKLVSQFKAVYKSYLKNL